MYSLFYSEYVYLWKSHHCFDHTKKKLTGDNFIKWKSNMNLLLVSENHKFVLNEECPEEPGVNAPKHVREKFDAWIQSNNKATC